MAVTPQTMAYGLTLGLPLGNLGFQRFKPGIHFRGINNWAFFGLGLGGGGLRGEYRSGIADDAIDEYGAAFINSDVVRVLPARQRLVKALRCRGDVVLRFQHVDDGSGAHRPVLRQQLKNDRYKHFGAGGAGGTGRSGLPGFAAFACRVPRTA